MPAFDLLGAIERYASVGRALEMDARVNPDGVTGNGPQIGRGIGKVLFHDNFADGFCGWRDHQGGSTPYPPISLCDYPAHNGRSLMLSSPDAPFADLDSSLVGFSAYRNLSRFRDTGLMSFGGWITTGSMREEPAWNSWGIGIDTQEWDNSSRGFFKLTCRGRGTNTPAWYLTDDAGTNVIISGTGDRTAGENEIKFNFNYVRLTIDLDANGGTGGYHEAQINDETYDLRSLGAGRGLQTPQFTNYDTSNDRYNSYAGGFNCGIFGSANSSVGGGYPVILVANDLVCTMMDPE